jgi:hypothetical protein
MAKNHPIFGVKKILALWKLRMWVLEWVGFFSSRKMSSKKSPRGGMETPKASDR